LPGPCYPALGLFGKKLDKINKNIAEMQLFRRSFSSAVKYSAYGPPSTVLKREGAAVSSQLEASQVAIKLLGAPINPSDINQVINYIFQLQRHS
jgi:hypothetical protein